MLSLRRCLSLFAFLLLGLPFAHAQNTVYAITLNGAFGTLNLTTGAFAQLGSAGTTPAGMSGLGNNLFLGADSGNTLYFVNPAAGNLSPIGMSTLPGGFNDFGGTTSGLYGVGNDNNLYLLNSQSGASTLVGSLGVNLSGASSVSSNGGTLYLALDTGSGSVLYSVNTSTGAATRIGSTGVSHILAMVFANDLLYGANPSGNLYTLNTSTGAATLVANSGQNIYGMAALAAPLTPLRLVNVTPCRLVDTRQGSPIQGGTYQTFNLPALAQAGGANNGCSGFNLANAQAYSLNVTLVPISHRRVGYLTIWPTGQAQPLVSLLNSDGRTKANAAIVPSGTGGAVNVYVTDTTNVLIDIDAYFDSAGDSSALAFYPLPPCRVVDTRGGQDGGTLQAGQERDFSIPGNCGIPGNATAYSFNVTVIPASGGLDYLTVWPQGENMPVVSTINDSTGTVAANAAIVPAGTNSKTAFYPHSNSTDLLVDTNGYFAPPSPGTGSGSSPLSLFTLTPCRVIDTRNGIGEFTGTIPVAVVGSSCGVPGSSSEAFVFNATVVPDSTTHLSYLTLWPDGETMPVVSTLNAYDGAVTSNMAIVPAGPGNNAINAFAGEEGTKYTNLILDIASYFAPVPTLSLDTTSLPVGTRNSGYSVTLAASGGVPPYSWSLSGGSLPTGLSLSSSGTIAGMPTGTGTFNFSVQVQDSESPAQATARNFQLTVNASQGTLSINTASLPSGTVNTVYSTVLSANGGLTPYAWNVIAGSLPAGLGFSSSTGQITGTPQAPGLSVFTVQVTDAENHTAMAVLPVTIDGGNSNGSLNGMYAFSFTGYDGNSQTPFVVAGSLTMDGNGNVTGGEYDLNGMTHGAEHDTITGGNYTISSNGQGQLSFTDNTGANIQMFVAVGDGQDIRIISMDVSGENAFWGAGVLRQQNPSAFNLAAGAGTWAFGSQGFDTTGEPIAIDGTYQEDASGNVNGTEDINDFGTHSQTIFTGHVTSNPPISANGRVTLQFQVAGIGTLHYVSYIISTGEVLEIGIDSGGAIGVLNALRQSTNNFSNSNLNGKSVGRGSRQHGAGGGSPNSQATVQLLQSSNGNLTVSEYDNTGGTVSNGTLTGTYTVASNGRTPVNFTDGSQVVCYLVTTNEGYCINTVPQPGHNVNGAELTYFEPQTGGPFGLTSVAGQYTAGSLPQYVSSTASSIDTFFTDGAGNASFVGTESGPGGIEPQSGAETYTVDNTGLVTILAGSSPSAYGYVVNANKFEVISTDGNPRLLIHVRSAAP